MTSDDKKKVPKGQKAPDPGIGIEYRATIRFPKKDYEFMQKLIEEGEYTNVTEIVRDAVKRFRLEWTEMESTQGFMPMGSRGRMMPWMKMMMSMCQADEEEERKRKKQ
jgi:Arc/MetJ-type ribon-helix-helix transcriptional regulator